MAKAASSLRPHIVQVVAANQGLATVHDLVLQLQKCGKEFQAASVMAAPGRCLVPPSPPGPPQH